MFHKVDRAVRVFSDRAGVWQSFSPWSQKDGVVKVGFNALSRVKVCDGNIMRDVACCYRVLLILTFFDRHPRFSMWLLLNGSATKLPRAEIGYKV